MKNIFYITIVLLSFSCTNFVWQKLWYIKKDMSIDEVIKIIESEEYEKGIEFINNKNEDIHILNENSKVILTYKQHSKEIPLHNSYYVFYFKNDKLIYWGLIYEFARHKNEELSKVAEEIGKIIKEKYNDI